MIRLACPGCARKLAIEDSRAGQVGKCPACGGKLQIPQISAPPAATLGDFDSLALADESPPTAPSPPPVATKPAPQPKAPAPKPKAASRPAAPPPEPVFDLSLLAQEDAATDSANGADDLEVVEDDPAPPPRKAKPAPRPKQAPVVEEIPEATLVEDELDELDELEEVDDEPAPPRRKTAVRAKRRVEEEDDVELYDEDDDPPVRSKKRPKRERWEVIAAATAGGVLLILAVLTWFFPVISYVLIGIGLPASLLSRKWYLLGACGLAYLLVGGGFLVLNRFIERSLPSGPPPRDSSPREVDTYCSSLLRDPNRVEAKAWAASVAQSKHRDALAELIASAYSNGAREVWACNPRQLDPGNNPAPDLVVVLPDDADKRRRFFDWRKLRTFRSLTDSGQKYFYLDLE